MQRYQTVVGLPEERRLPIFASRCVWCGQEIHRSEVDAHGQWYAQNGTIGCEQNRQGMYHVPEPALPAGQTVEYDGEMSDTPEEQPRPSSFSTLGFEYDTTGMTPEQTQRADALAHWWMNKAAAEVAKMVPKAIAYGSSDLKVMGEAMLELHPRMRGVVDGQELAIWFYVQGKIARLLGGYAQGELPDEDSWWDLKVYAGMAQHVREFGGW